MKKSYGFPVSVEVEADSLDEALVRLWQRLGFDGDWLFGDGPGGEVSAYERSGSLDPVRIDSTEVRSVVAGVAGVINERNPHECSRVPCCSGTLMFAQKPVCQLSTEETGKLMAVAQVLATASADKE